LIEKVANVTKVQCCVTLVCLFTLGIVQNTNNKRHFVIHNTLQFFFDKSICKIVLQKIDRLIVHLLV